MGALESQYDACAQKIFETLTNLDEKEKFLGNAEGDVGALSRRVILLEVDVETSEERLAKAVTELANMSHRAVRSHLRFASLRAESTSVRSG